MNHACFRQGHKDSTLRSTPEKTVWQLSITLHSEWKNDQVESCALLHAQYCNCLNYGDNYSSVHNNHVQIATREKMNHACFWWGHKNSTPGSTPEKTVWQLSITLHSEWKNDQVESCALLHLHNAVVALITETITILCIIIVCKYQLPGYTAESTTEIAVSDLPLVCIVDIKHRCDSMWGTEYISWIKKFIGQKWIFQKLHEIRAILKTVQ